MYEHSYPEKRFKQSIKFLRSVIPPPAEILDLGTNNPLSDIMRNNGYSVQNTSGEDFDLHPEIVTDYNAEVVTAFEILEHLVAPFNVLRHINSQNLVATVPLNLWFARAYRNPNNPWGRHFHEFEDWQFDWLLEKAGWKIMKREKWVSPSKKIGFRPILRNFTPRYYAVYAVRREFNQNG